jgi:hypothetical protein
MEDYIGVPVGFLWHGFRSDPTSYRCFAVGKALFLLHPAPADLQHLEGMLRASFPFFFSSFISVPVFL